jgi:hypothetical protein
MINGKMPGQPKVVQGARQAMQQSPWKLAGEAACHAYYLLARNNGLQILYGSVAIRGHQQSGQRFAVWVPEAKP